MLRFPTWRQLRFLFLIAGIIGALDLLTIPIFTIYANSQAELTSMLLTQEALSLLAIAVAVLAYRDILVQHRRGVIKVLAVIAIITAIQLARYPYNVSALWSAYTGIGREFLTCGQVPVTSHPWVRRIRPGMTKEQIVKLMGRPSHRRDDEWTYSYWFYWGNLTVKFDDKGIVLGTGHGYG